MAEEDTTDQTYYDRVTGVKFEDDTLTFKRADDTTLEVPVAPASLNGLVTTGTAIGTAAKTTTSEEPPAGSIVPVKFTNGNSAETPTLAFNGGTARAMKLGGTASTAAKLTVAANGVVLFYFDGTVLHQAGVVS